MNAPRIRAANKAALILLFMPTVATGTPEITISSLLHYIIELGMDTNLWAFVQCCTDCQRHLRRLL